MYEQIPAQKEPGLHFDAVEETIEAFRKSYRIVIVITYQSFTGPNRPAILGSLIWRNLMVIELIYIINREGRIHSGTRFSGS